MNEIQVTMTELRQSLGRLVNRAAFGGERIVLVAHGEPKAAIISCDVTAVHRVHLDQFLCQHIVYFSAATAASKSRIFWRKVAPAIR